MKKGEKMFIIRTEQGGSTLFPSRTMTVLLISDNPPKVGDELNFGGITNNNCITKVWAIEEVAARGLLNLKTSPALVYGGAFVLLKNKKSPT